MTVYRTVVGLALAALVVLFVFSEAVAQYGGAAGQDRAVDQNQATEQDRDLEPDQSIERREQVLEGRADAADYAQTVEKAATVFNDIMGSPDQNIPPQILSQAQAIAIVPDLVKASLIAGGRHGTGVLLMRNGNNWSAPIFVSVSGASIGAQLGVAASDLVLAFNQREDVMEVLEGDDFTLGVDAIVAAGPSGAAAVASTQDADIYSYKSSEGLFAGVSLTGGVMTTDQDATMAYYNIDPEQARGYYGDESQMMQTIVGAQQGGRPLTHEVPQSAKQLQDVLNRYMQQSGNRQQ